MYIGLYIFWRLKLDNQVDFGDVETSCCHVCRDKALEFPFLEALERHLPLLLRNISMEHMRLLLQIGLGEYFICLLLRLAEDDGSAVESTVQVNDVRNDCVPRIVRTVNT